MATVVVGAEAARAKLATWAVQGAAAHRAGKAASRRHRRRPRPNPHAHGKGEVKVSPDYELIEIKSEGGAYPQSTLCCGGKRTGDDEKPNLTDYNAWPRLKVGRMAS
jgi:hypothetical protein